MLTSTPAAMSKAVDKLMVSSFGSDCREHDSQPHLKQRLTANETCHAIAYHWSSPPKTLLMRGLA